MKKNLLLVVAGACTLILANCGNRCCKEECPTEQPTKVVRMKKEKPAQTKTQGTCTDACATNQTKAQKETY